VGRKLLTAGFHNMAISKPTPRVLILALPHGAAHLRASKALQTALREIQPGATVEIADALNHCTRWFRAYYDSYRIPLKYWPGLWARIEKIQHQSKSTGPGWLYRQGAKPLFRFIENFHPDIVVATEVGVCELVSMHKRENGARYLLVGVELMDFNQAWVQREVDLFLCTHEDLAAELARAGAAASKLFTSGQPIDPIFARLPDRASVRARLGITVQDPVLLVLFGGAGFGDPDLILGEIRRVRQPLQIIVIAGGNPGLRKKALRLCEGLPHARVLGWVDNMQEWMLAADLLISKPGGATLAEAFACGLPVLAIDPLPGNEQRTCQWIEKWGSGIWVKEPRELASVIEHLLQDRDALQRLRERSRSLARPRAAYDAAEAILSLSRNLSGWRGNRL
jgi:processive 1,2-diacylglycerol beta-glucosyltransferase